MVLDALLTAIRGHLTQHDCRPTTLRLSPNMLQRLLRAVTFVVPGGAVSVHTFYGVPIVEDPRLQGFTIATSDDP